MNRNPLLLCGISFVLLLLSIYLYTRSEQYSIQYLAEHPNALENQAFRATPVECTSLCKKYNKNKNDQIECMDYCNLNSGFIPTLNMIPNGEILLSYL